MQNPDLKIMGMGDALDNQKVHLFFRTVSRLADDKEAVLWDSPRCHVMESEARGEYYKKGEVNYCLYEEQPEGWDMPYKVMLKWEKAIFERHIRGNKASHMVFEPGKSHSNLYHTPYGDLLLETETRRLEITERQDAFSVLLEYGIKQEGQIVSENRMEIQIRKVG